MTDTGGGVTWTRTFTAPSDAGDSGTAAVTISGTDVAGNPNLFSTNNTFTVDNTP